MKRNLKLYVWENVFSDYTHGLAVVLASSVEEARVLLKSQKLFDWEEDEIDANEPVVYEDKVAVFVRGGG